MKVAILAGGYGTRLIEETKKRPKALVKIREKPILWHIMKYYSHFGFKEFIIALGYKGENIKRWIYEYLFLKGNITFNTVKGKVIFQDKNIQNDEDWIVCLVDTGQKT